jgi:hypothetical protein
MLMDIETGSIEKKEKQPKQKKTNGQKRLIAGMIATCCFGFAGISTLPGIIARNIYDKDIRELDDKQNAIYEEFMESTEFASITNEQFMQLADDYSSGVIDYDTFRDRLNTMFTVENAKEVIANSNNTELKAQVEEIEQQKEERREEYNSNIVPKLSASAVCAGVAATVGFTIASAVYTNKEINEEKRKKKANKIKLQDYETGPVLIDKTSCNENCLGTRYYDSTTMTIRNTNGQEEKNEEKSKNEESVGRHILY